MASTYLTKTFGSSGNQKTFTISFWFKRSNLTTGHFFTYQDASSQIRSDFSIVNDRIGINFNPTGSAWGADLTIQDSGSNILFRDTNGWYHLVMAFDTTQATEANRIKVYVNGVQKTMSAYPSQNFDTGYSTAIEHAIGTYAHSVGGNYFDGLMSHFHFIDGTAYDASAFGSTDSTTGEWKINTSPSVNYGTNGFFILKDGNSVTDQSGNSNNFTVAGGTLTKTEDCPSNVFATLNPLDKHIGGTAPTFSNGNNTWSSPGNGSSNAACKGTIGASSGKYYFEVKFTAAQYTNAGMSLVDGTNGWNGDGDIATQSSFYGIQAGGSKRVAGTNTSSVFTALSNNDIGMFAYDFDNNKFWFGVNGSWVASGNPTTGANSLGTLASGIYLPSISNGFWNGVSTAQFNFGNGYFGTTAVSSAGTNASGIGIFEYDVPTGYTALSTKGLNL